MRLKKDITGSFKACFAGHTRETIDAAARSGGKIRMLHMSKKLLSIVALLGFYLQPPMVNAETIMTPRSKAEHEAEIRALNEKYAPKADAQLEAQVQASGGVLPSATRTPTGDGEAQRATIESARRQAESVAMAAVGGTQTPTAGTKVRAELAAVGLDKFMFGGKIYSREDLMPILVELGKLYKLDHLVLLATGEPIQLSHLVALSKLSDGLKLPALYQYGTELRAVSTR